MQLERPLYPVPSLAFGIASLPCLLTFQVKRRSKHACFDFGGIFRGAPPPPPRVSDRHPKADVEVEGERPADTATSRPYESLLASSPRGFAVLLPPGLDLGTSGSGVV